MKIAILLSSLWLISSTMLGQKTNLLDMEPPAEFDNVHAAKLAHDSLSSSFVIWVKNGVKPHYHQKHTETLYVLSGTGEMSLGEKVFSIGAGDFVEIPRGEVHGVTTTSDEPLQVLSIQAPEFFGKDRIFAGQLKKK
ncbi:MAG: cupin domain-containing protein [Flavobacteriales bacterium]|nr:cupin domain-containing protein [Flavobacteriales bacterium]